MHGQKTIKKRKICIILNYACLFSCVVQTSVAGF
jgi:hypothetical protein